MKFVLTCTDVDNTVTQKSFESEYLDDVVGNVGDFLRGVGFYFDELVVNNEDATPSPRSFLTEQDD